jgi:hypothetical protein
MGPKDHVEQVFDEIGELRQIRRALEKKSPHWTESFKIITPIMLFIASYFMSTLNESFNRLNIDVKDMRIEVSKHLQNSEFHIPRATVVSRDEFVIYQTMRDKQMVDLQCSLGRIESKLDEHAKRIK